MGGNVKRITNEMGENIDGVWILILTITIRCGNDADGNQIEAEAERGDNRISSNACVAINQVTDKLVDWTSTYLATCKPKKRANLTNKFNRMNKNMRRAAKCEANV